MISFVEWSRENILMPAMLYGANARSGKSFLEWSKDEILPFLGVVVCLGIVFGVAVVVEAALKKALAPVGTFKRWIATWHPGKILILWGLTLMVLWWLHDTQGEWTDENILAALLAALPVTVLTWFWLGSREKR